MRKVIAFEIDGTLVVVLILAGVALLFALHAAYPNLYKYWPDSSQDLAAWVQAVGSIGALVGLWWATKHQLEAAERLRVQLEQRERVKTLEALHDVSQFVQQTATKYQARLLSGRIGAPRDGELLKEFPNALNAFLARPLPVMALRSVVECSVCITRLREGVALDLDADVPKAKVTELIYLAVDQSAKVVKVLEDLLAYERSLMTSAPVVEGRGAAPAPHHSL